MLVVFGRQILRVVFDHTGFHVWLLLYNFSPLESFLSLQNDGVGAIGHAQHFDDFGHGTYFIEVGSVGHFNVIIFLTDNSNALLALVGFLDLPNRAISADGDGNHNAWK